MSQTAGRSEAMELNYKSRASSLVDYKCCKNSLALIKGKTLARNTNKETFKLFTLTLIKLKSIFGCQIMSMTEF